MDRKLNSGIELENILKFHLDLYKINYKYESKEAAFFDFSIFHNNKDYIVEVKSFIPNRMTIENIFKKYLSLEKKFDCFYLLVPSEKLNDKIKHNNIFKENINFEIIIFKDLLGLLNIQEVASNEIVNNIIINYSNYQHYFISSNINADNISDKLNDIIDDLNLDYKNKKYPLEIYQKQLSEHIIDRLNKDTVCEDEIFSYNKERNIIIMISDIKNFSSLVRLIDKSIIFNVIDQYYKSVRYLCKSYNVFLDKFVGDSVVVAFNYPYEDTHSAIDCINFAFELIEFGNKHFHGFENDIDEYIETGTRIGAAIGNLFPVKIFKNDVSFIGNTINLASRLENNCALDKVLISQKLYTKINNECKTEFNQKYISKYEVHDKEKFKGQFSNIKSYLIEKV